MKKFIENHEQEMLKLLERLVNIDSGSYNKAGVDKIGNLLSNAYQKIDFTIERKQNKNLGDHLIVQLHEAQDPNILIIAHMDTEYPDDTATKRPFTLKHGRAYAIAVIDMQASPVYLLYAIHSLRNPNKEAYKNVVIILNSDEKIGSPSSKELIEKMARGKQYALVMEPARANGAIVSASRGGGSYTLTVKGKAS